MTREFRKWLGGLDDERKAKVQAALKRIEAGGPTMGRPHVDVIHGTRLRKLKEARIDRGTRVLFVFDANRKVLALVGGDKTGKWNRWYPAQIKRAEDLYRNHGGEPPGRAGHDRPKDPPER